MLYLPSSIPDQLHSFRTASGWQVGTCEPSCAHNSNLFAFFYQLVVYRTEKVCFASFRVTPINRLWSIRAMDTVLSCRKFKERLLSMLHFSTFAFSGDFSSRRTLHKRNPNGKGVCHLVQSAALFHRCLPCVTYQNGRLADPRRNVYIFWGYRMTGGVIRAV